MFLASGVAKAHAICSFGGFRQGIKNVSASTAWLLPPTLLTRLRILLLVLILETDKMSILSILPSILESIRAARRPTPLTSVRQGGITQIFE